MTPQRFQEIERLFHAALDRPDEERLAFINAACGNDTELHRELMALLDSEGKAETHLNSLVRGAAASLDEQSPGADVGRQIGPYTLIREVGRGGMGVVYQALRSDGEFFQTVALKLVKRGMDTDHILRRFRAERQILATLSHPNIASLLDGGTTDDGRPYFVMEYIEGKPLLKYCQGKDVAQKLELFRAICAATHHAHQRKVIHRDLKPGNVLVTGEGTPKLLDFGIAKLHMPELMGGEGPLATTGSFQMLTPEYASPEQIRGEAVTAAADVYSLGVILYEMLAGRRPPKSETRPPRPSLQTPGLGRDLDNIIVKAMQPDPGRRYQSAIALSEDVGRYQANETVEARGEEFRDRARHLVRRSGRIAVAVVLGLILVATSVVASRRYQAARPPKTLADQVLMEMYLRANDLMAQDPRLKDWPGGIPAQFLEAMKLLEQVTSREPTFPGAWTQLSEAYRYGTEFDGAHRDMWRQKAKAAALQAVRLDAESADAYFILGDIALYEEWDFTAAEKFLKRAVDLNPHMGTALRNYADLLRITGRSEQARSEVDRALSLDPNNARLRLQRGLLLYDVGQCDVARVEADRAAALRANYVAATWLKGLCLEREGRYEEARTLFEKALQETPAEGRIVPAIGHLYAKMGLRENALSVIASLRSLQAKGKKVTYSLGLIYAALGEKERALEELENAWQERDDSLIYMGVEWRFRPIAGEAKFQELLRRLRIRK